MIFAVLDLSPLTVYINCSFFTFIVYKRRYINTLSFLFFPNALRHGSHSFTCKLHHAGLYSPAAERRRPLAGTNFTVPRRVEG